MTNATLRNAVRSIVDRYGYEQVDECLKELHALELQDGSNASLSTESSRRVPVKPTAPEYVAKLDMPAEKKEVAVQLAERFHEKTFLPSFGEISHFCRQYGINEPRSKSRASAIPRVFKFIADMEPNDLERILDEGLFSGPSRLGPIADAIRRNGKSSHLL